MGALVNYPPKADETVEDYGKRYCWNCRESFKSPRGLAIHNGRVHSIRPLTHNPDNPARKIGTVEMVSVEWIMQHTNGSCDGFSLTPQGMQCEGVPQNNGWTTDYARMVYEKGCDSQMGAIVHTLQTRGFRCPIVLFEYAGMLLHGNGHHRFVAALLLGLDAIPVFWTKEYNWLSGGEFMGYGKSDYEELDYSGVGYEMDDLGDQLYYFWNADAEEERQQRKAEEEVYWKNVAKETMPTWEKHLLGYLENGVLE